MTEEERGLLLKDLCARLQNKVMIYLHTSSEITGSAIILNSSIYGFIEDVLNNSPYEIKEIKPYLRPMSSMTKEEKVEYDSFNAPTAHRKVWVNRIDWLLSNHFDFRGLIPMGLALAAPKGMYNN